MTIDYMNPANRNCRKYILLRDIGQGKNARAYLGVGEDGKACAMKFYLDQDDPEDFSPDEREKKCVEHFEETRRKVRVEVQRWNTLQKDYKDYVHLLKLNKQNVLIMPVFAPLPSEDRERLLPAVERKLLEFFNNGYVYDEVRWQHIGCRHVDISGEAKKQNSVLDLVLLDLESLKEKTDETEHHVKEQIASLRRRMHSDAAGGHTSLLLAAHAPGM